MMTLVNFLMGNNSNIDDEGGEGGQKGHFRDEVICERSLSSRAELRTNVNNFFLKDKCAMFFVIAV